MCVCRGRIGGGGGGGWWWCGNLVGPGNEVWGGWVEGGRDVVRRSDCNCDPLWEGENEVLISEQTEHWPQLMQGVFLSGCLLMAE